MSNNFTQSNPEIWGGIECTYNRVGELYFDQLEKSGYYERPEDIDRIAALGIKTMRFPAIWEKWQPEQNTPIDWSFIASRLERMQFCSIEPIAGLVHHGSGPKWVNFFDGSFELGLAAYAEQFARQFPFVNWYTPVNEPLTTARFCGLYGHWYPHATDDNSFLQILLSECRAVVLSMEAIRRVNPGARLVQTDDLGKTHSTKMLQQQAWFENQRRWLSYDLLCGRVDETHPLYEYLIGHGVSGSQLQFFIEKPCKPDIIGINHYLTSERYLDQNLHAYPPHTWGGNGYERYADIEAVRISKNVVDGPYRLLKEAWQRYQLPLAVTEVHLHCTREEQLRWFRYVHDEALKLKKEGADLRAVTAWAVYGSFDWCSLLTRTDGIYEPGLFDIRSGQVRPTALTKIVQQLANNQPFKHPVMEEKGWWQRDCRVIYHVKGGKRMVYPNPAESSPVIITGKTGTLGNAFARICALRGIKYLLTGREDLNIADEVSVRAMIDRHKPWAIINAAGFVRVDDAEKEAENCFLANTVAPGVMSSVCRQQGIKFVTFSSDLVFNGQKNIPYLESDMVSPLNIYGQSKARAEELVLENDKDALIIRTSAFFGPWDRYNFVHSAINAFRHQSPFPVASDITVSPTYVPDLVNTTLDLLIDDENGIWNLSNQGEITWAMLAGEIAGRAGFDKDAFLPVSIRDMRLPAQRPRYSVLTTEKGLALPSLDNALGRFFREQELLVL